VTLQSQFRCFLARRKLKAQWKACVTISRICGAHWLKLMCFVSGITSKLSTLELLLKSKPLLAEYAAAATSRPPSCAR
jgi:hypothetical protein